MKAKRRYVRNVRDKSLALPTTLEDLIRQGGPLTCIQEVERQAGDAEARFWLGVLEVLAPPSGEDMRTLMMFETVQMWVKTMRRRLGIKPTPEAVRAQTRERVRRYRARKAETGSI